MAEKGSRRLSRSDPTEVAHAVLERMMEHAVALQQVLNGLKRVAEQDALLDETFSSVVKAHGSLVKYVLTNHFDEVTLRFDRSRPQQWDDYYAVLEICYEGLVVRLPVPAMDILDFDLADKVKARLEEPEQQEPEVA